MITTPPTSRTTSWNEFSDEPSSPATAPRPANTVVKPAMKINVAGMARAGSCASPTSPTMMPRYAGTSGTMHGARNDATPAPKSATICAITGRSPVGHPLSEREGVRLEAGTRGREREHVVADLRAAHDAVHVGSVNRDDRAAVAIFVHARTAVGGWNRPAIELDQHVGRLPVRGCHHEVHFLGV